ncbi:uncharacterized protein LOC110728660 [Chenopodium quinoa]|uniref:uncharacterized protein LOC110728660 n=1 Tax=Chenopodium quinoa TaxID=63459 RepID=UPI000B78827C|nr:uncharacterized protein LOC110728660 [Chenopodium quinoa]
MSTTFHPATDGQTERTIQTLEDMLRACVIDFQGGLEDSLDLIEFSYNNRSHASIDTVKQLKEIQAKIQAAQDRQKSYADLKRREEEFEVGDKVLLKVSPMKGVMRFGKKGKLSPKYIPDKSHVLQPETIELDKILIYEERLVKILDSKVRSTRNKEAKIVKVLWSNQEYEEATREAEDEMRKKYPELFEWELRSCVKDCGVVIVVREVTGAVVGGLNKKLALAKVKCVLCWSSSGLVSVPSDVKNLVIITLDSCYLKQAPKLCFGVSRASKLSKLSCQQGKLLIGRSLGCKL